MNAPDRDSVARADSVKRPLLGPRIPRTVWAVQAAGFVSSLGHGTVIPFVLIYLHDVRHFDLATAGVLAGTFSLMAIAVGPAAGPLIDGIGAKASLLVSLALISVGYAAFAFSGTPTTAFAAAAVAGAGQAGFSPAHSNLLVVLAPAHRLPQAFALRRAADNLGLGLGAVLGGLLITDSDQLMFRALFLIDALTSLLFAAVVLAVRTPPTRSPGDDPRTSYRDVVRSPMLLAVNALIFVLAAAGYAQVGSTFTAFAKDNIGVTARMIGLIFLLNALTVAGLALPAARILEGRRRMHGVAFIGFIWAAAWLVSLSAEAWHGQPALLLAPASVLLALGECAYGAVVRPLVAALAPRRATGRALALADTSLRGGLGVGAAAGAMLLARRPGVLWLTMAVLCGSAAAGALRLERRMSTDVLRQPAWAGSA